MSYVHVQRKRHLVPQFCCYIYIDLHFLCLYSMKFSVISFYRVKSLLANIYRVLHIYTKREINKYVVNHNIHGAHSPWGQMRGSSPGPLTSRDGRPLIQSNISKQQKNHHELRDGESQL